MSRKRKNKGVDLSREEKKALTTVLQLPVGKRKSFYSIAEKVLKPSEVNIIIETLEVIWDGLISKPKNRQFYTLKDLISDEDLQLLASAALVYIEDQKRNAEKEVSNLFSYALNYNL